MRRVPLLADVAGTATPALALEMWRVATDTPAFSVSAVQRGLLRVTIGDIRIPAQADGAIWLRYSPHDPSRFVSASRVFAGKADRQLFEAKLVLIGVTGLGLLDFQATPLGERIPGVEVHAQILEQIFDGATLRRPTAAAWLEAALLAAAGLALVAFVPVVRPAISALLFAGVLAALAATGILGFRGGLLLNVAAPALGAALVLGALFASTLAEADRQRRLLREAQARVAGELEAAHRIQMGLLPAPRLLFAGEPRFALEALLEPARSVGGDFYDCFMLDSHRVFFIVGDVSGKGLGASLFMALSKSLIKSIALRAQDEPAAILERANAEISRDNPESLFVTAFAGVLDARTGRLAFCSAGHEPPIASAPGKAPVRVMLSGGPPLCVVHGYAYESGQLDLPQGGWLCVVTDGVTEAMNARSELYGTARLLSVLRGLESAAPEAVIAAVRDDVRRFAGSAEQSDDVALLCVRWNGSPR